MTGWIKIHRQIKEHWIWDDAERFKWWMDILMSTNFKGKKTELGGKISVVERGSFHTSEMKLSERWGVSRNRVRRFINLLESDNMITTKKTRDGTTIKVCNYAVYQAKDEEEKQLTEQLMKHATEQLTEQSVEQQEDKGRNNKETTNETADGTRLKNVKNYKNVKNEKNEKKESASDFFQNNGFGFITQYTSEDLNYYLDSFESDSDEIVIAALKVAKDRNKVSWGYAKSILNIWLQSNLQSIEQVRAYETQQKGLRKQNQSTHKPLQSKEITPKWLEQGYQPEVDENKDETLEADRAAFLEKLKNK
ncbi:DnaD domain protein [Staphylococcus xylosus]